MHDQRSRTRYPGTFSFGDTEADREAFRGRDKEKEELCDLVLSHDLVVMYGPSGVGKTSLLQAGIFQKLRERDFLPLPIKLTTGGGQSRPQLLEICWAAIAEACEAQKIKSTPSEPEKYGLWEFFKTVLFLKRAEPQEPVLIFDEFENIFAAYDRDSRLAFAKELGEVLGRTPPDRVRVRQEREVLPFSESPPRVKVLICVNEDRLGSLQEFIEYLPGILRNRFRLVALGRKQAEQALVVPAGLEDEGYRTPPFKFSDKAVEQMLDFLMGEASAIEPLALQVLCSAIEGRVAAGNLGADITSEGIGGRKGLEKTLRDFYHAAVASLPRRRRRKVRRLCAEALISQDKHRLLIHGPTLEKRYRLPRTIFKRLDERHILRDVEQLGSLYYALSCDVLVPPVLKARPWPIEKIAAWTTAVVATFCVAGLVILMILESGWEQLANDFKATDAQLGDLVGDTLKNQDNMGWTTTADVINHSSDTILNLEDNYRHHIPDELNNTENGRQVYRDAMAHSDYYIGKVLTRKISNLEDWTGRSYDNNRSKENTDDYDHAIDNISAGIALRLGAPIELAQEPFSGELWAMISARLTPESADNLGDYVSDLVKAYIGRAAQRMDVKADLTKAEEDLKRARKLVQNLSLSNTDYNDLRFQIDLAFGDLEYARGRLLSARDIYERLSHSAVAKEVELKSKDPNDLSMEYNIGQMSQRLSDVLIDDFELDNGSNNLQRGSKIFRHFFSSLPDGYLSPSTFGGRQMIRNTIVFDDRLGEVAMAGYDQASAVLAHNSALAQALQRLSKTSESGAGRIVSFVHLASALEGQQNFEKVCERLETLIEQESLYAPRKDLASCKMELGAAKAAGGVSDAEAALQDALQDATKLALELNKNDKGSDPVKGVSSPSPDSELDLTIVGSHIELGRLYLQNGRFAEAKERYEKADAIAEHWMKAAPDVAAWREAGAKVYDGLGDVSLSGAELDQALSSYELAQEIRSDLIKPDTTSGKRRLDLAVSEYKLASLGELAGKDNKEVEAHRGRAVAILKELEGAGRLPPIAKAWPEVFAQPHPGLRAQ